MPLTALIDNERQYATREGTRRGHCPGCGSDMRAKTGDHVSWHWAHLTDVGAGCPSFGETEWHLNWKRQVGDIDRVEQARGPRRGDALTPYGWAVEFQHSPMDSRECTSRERDWSRRLIWVVDVADQAEASQFEWFRPSGRAHLTLRWRWARKWVRNAHCATFLDLGQDRLIYVGKWRERSPLIGYGWALDTEMFAVHVLNGRRPPTPPGMGMPLHPGRWSQPLTQAASAEAAAAHTKSRRRTQHGQPVLCPDCESPWRTALEHTECADWKRWDTNHAHVDTSEHLPCALCGGLTFSRGSSGHPVHRRCCFQEVAALRADQHEFDVSGSAVA